MSLTLTLTLSVVLTLTPTPTLTSTLTRIMWTDLGTMTNSDATPVAVKCAPTVLSL